MSFYNKLERKLGRFALPHLIVYVIAAYGIGIVLTYVAPGIMPYLTLEPYYIIHNFQIWRLISWIFIPSQTGFWALIMMLFYYHLGTNLEYLWGTFRFNVYIFMGIFFTDVASVILYFILLGINGSPSSFGFLFSTSYINLAMFLAYAVCFPEHEVRLYFILPVKMKWLAIVYVALCIYDCIIGGWVVATCIIASLLNFIIFYLSVRNISVINPREVKRKKEFKEKINVVNNRTNRYECAICGRTDKSNPELQFRYCSKCNGAYAYCQDHLFTHEHRR